METSKIQLDAKSKGWWRRTLQIPEEIKITQVHAIARCEVVLVCTLQPTARGSQDSAREVALIAKELGWFDRLVVVSTEGVFGPEIAAEVAWSQEGTHE